MSLQNIRNGVANSGHLSASQRSLAEQKLDFAAEYAHTCALFFDGKIHSKTWAKEFFSNNNFYTTDASRIARSVFPGVITTGELEKAVKEGEGKWKHEL